MSPATHLFLNYLILAEPFVTVGALLAWLRAGKRGYSVSTMRDYLVVRSVNAIVNVCLLYVLLGHGKPFNWRLPAYLYEFWAGFFVQEWFMLRVVGELLQGFLRPLRGLQTLVKVVFRWVLVAARLLALPAVVAFAMIFESPTLHLDVVFRFFAMVAIAQIFPITSVAILGLYAGCKPSGRNFGILIGFSLEPAWLIIASCIRVNGVLVWTNLVNEIVCYAALGIWSWYAFHPDREDSLPRSNATLQHWDQIARRALRHRLPAVEESEGMPQGGRPWPSGREL